MQKHQLSFSQAEHEKKKKTTRRDVFLDKMDHVVPWARLVEVIAPYYPKGGDDCQLNMLFALSNLYRVRAEVCLRQTIRRETRRKEPQRQGRCSRNRDKRVKAQPI